MLMICIALNQDLLALKLLFESNFRFIAECSLRFLNVGVTFSYGLYKPIVTLDDCDQTTFDISFLLADGHLQHMYLGRNMYQ